MFSSERGRHFFQGSISSESKCLFSSSSTSRKTSPEENAMIDIAPAMQKKKKKNPKNVTNSSRRSLTKLTRSISFADISHECSFNAERLTFSFLLCFLLEFSRRPHLFVLGKEEISPAKHVSVSEQSYDNRQLMQRGGKKESSRHK